MQRRRTPAFLAVSISLLAACGGSGDDTAGGADETTTTSIAAGDTAPTTAATTSSTSTTTTTTTTSTTSTTSTTAPPTTVPEPSCLEGAWWLSPEGTTALYANLLPGFPVTVRGTHWVEIVGNTVDFWVNLEINVAIGGTDVTFGLDQHGVGTYTVADDVLSITYDTYESVPHAGYGDAITDPSRHPETYVDERVALTDNGDGTITIDGVTVPLVDIPPVAGGPVGCDGATMSLGYTSGLADTVAVYQRIA